MVGAFVLANNKETLNMDGCLWYFGGISSSLKAVYKETLNMDGCLWYFGGISSSLKAVYFGHTNKKCTSVSGVLQNGQFISLLRAKGLYRR